jgi:hypothetical protein
MSGPRDIPISIADVLIEFRSPFSFPTSNPSPVF